MRPVENSIVDQIARRLNAHTCQIGWEVQGSSGRRRNPHRGRRSLDTTSRPIKQRVDKNLSTCALKIGRSSVHAEGRDVGESRGVCLQETAQHSNERRVEYCGRHNHGAGGVNSNLGSPVPQLENTKKRALT